MSNKKYYTSDHISEEYESLSDKKKIGILHSALDYMQQYNGRSTFYCIALALGYENIEGERNTYTKR